MDIHFESCTGTLIISMIKYLSAMIKMRPEDLKGYTPNPHSDHLFNIRLDNDDKKELLPEKMAARFNRTTAQLLFLRLKAWTDTDSGVIFHDKGETT